MTGRDLRREKRWRREDWVHPFRRVHRALDASVRLIDASIRVAVRSERCAVRRPIDTSRQLEGASHRLSTAARRLGRAAQAIAEATECLARHPEDVTGTPPYLVHAARRVVEVGLLLGATSDQVFGLHEDLLQGLRNGELVPEPSAFERRRPRIILAPRPAPVRAFLRARQPRIVDRISALLQRRRRTRLPASLRVPRRTSQGRAPPLFPVCLL